MGRQTLRKGACPGLARCTPLLHAGGAPRQARRRRVCSDAGRAHTPARRRAGALTSCGGWGTTWTRCGRARGARVGHCPSRSCSASTLQFKTSQPEISAPSAHVTLHVCAIIIYPITHYLPTPQVEFILMGGTFMSLPPDYRDYFIRSLHDALSGARARRHPLASEVAARFEQRASVQHPPAPPLQPASSASTRPLNAPRTHPQATPPAACPRRSLTRRSRAPSERGGQ